MALFPLAQEQKYDSIPQDTESIVAPRKRALFQRQSIQAVLVTLVTAWATLTIYLATQAFDIPLHSPKYTSCGNSSSTALERGCSFDIISFSWQTPECYIPSLVSEFSNWHNWTFWTEQHGNASTITSMEEAFRGERDLWVTWAFHMLHCTFVWREAQFGYERGWIDAHVRSYPHTLHCQTMLMQRGIADDDNMILANVQYPECQKVGRRSGKMPPEFDRVGRIPPPPPVRQSSE